MPKSPFSEFLEREFTRIQYENGKRLTIAEFADILGFSPAAVSLWMNGERKPDKSSFISLSKTLSPEIYEYFDVPRPDPDLQAITKVWDRIPETSRRAIREQAEALVEGKVKKNTNDRQRSKSTI